ncbi:MAG: SAM-dependent methyltransferase, partial [Desulfotomaculales bacterium]
MGIGPGDGDQITPRARAALLAAEVIIGHDTYLDLLSDEILAGKEVFRSGMHKEVERCRLAVELARSGKKVAVVSSGDPGVYGMSGPVLEVLGEEELD